MKRKIYRTAFYVVGEDNPGPYYVNVARETEEEAMDFGQEILMDEFPNKFAFDIIPIGCELIGYKEVEGE